MKRKSFLITAIILFSAIAILNTSIAKADVHVYDDNNQYLGIVLAMNPFAVEIFIPSKGARWHSNNSIQPGCPLDRIYFESDNCTGTPYSDGSNPIIHDLGTLLGGFYQQDYSGKKTIEPGSSYYFDCQCYSTAGSPSAEYYPLTQQVQMPFTTPIAQPLRFEVQNRAVVIPLN